MTINDLMQQIEETERLIAVYRNANEVIVGTQDAAGAFTSATGLARAADRAWLCLSRVRLVVAAPWSAGMCVSTGRGWVRWIIVAVVGLSPILTFWLARSGGTLH